jgi:hypothetical protein
MICEHRTACETRSVIVRLKNFRQHEITVTVFSFVVWLQFSAFFLLFHFYTYVGPTSSHQPYFAHVNILWQVSFLSWNFLCLASFCIYVTPKLFIMYILRTGWHSEYRPLTTRLSPLVQSLPAPPPPHRSWCTIYVSDFITKVSYIPTAQLRSTVFKRRQFIQW